jgi:GDP-4-dehydro-6-deoxy-D-mannose reductase
MILADIVNELQRQCGITVGVEVDAAQFRAKDLPQIVGDSRKINSATGWSPKIPLEKTLQSLLDYWRTATKPDAEKDKD